MLKVKLAVAGLLLSLLVGVEPANAQQGDGPWFEVLPTGKVDKRTHAFIHFESKDKDYLESPWKQPGTASFFVEEYRYDPLTNLETFTIFESPDDHRRVEFRGPGYERGTYQFEGELRIQDLLTDDIWVAQLWHAVLIKYRADEGTGKLVYHAANAATGEAKVRPTTLAEGIRNQWVKINMIHSGAPSFEIQIRVSVEGVAQNEGKPYQFKTFDANGDFYVKYGAYCGPGQKQVVQWRNTRLWTK